MSEYRSIPVKLVDMKTGEAFYIDPVKGKVPWPDALERGAEPFWMQDIRIAQKRLESARRAAARAAGRSAPDQSK